LPSVKTIRNNGSFFLLTPEFHEDIIGEKAVRVGMLHCELEWEIPTCFI